LTELRLVCLSFTDVFTHRLAGVKRLEMLSLAGSSVGEKA
jgi:hypothetical protein